MSKRIHERLCGLVIFAALAIAVCRADTLVVVNNAGNQGANDTLHWSQLGVDQTVVGSNLSLLSANGAHITASLTGANSITSVVCAANPCSWTGAGVSAGDTLLWASDAGSGGNGPIILGFGSGITGAGALIQANAPGQFTAKIEAFNGAASLGSFTVNSNANGDAVYLGVKDQTAANITSLVFSITACGATDTSSCTDFAIDTVNLNITAIKAVMISPTPGTTFAGTSVNFTWSSGTGVQYYSLRVGTQLGGTDVFNRFEPSSTSQTVTIPATGGTMFVRLYSYIAGVWQFNDYTYTASGTAVKAVMTLPVPGSTFPGTSVNFQWTTGTGVTYYSLRAGTQPGGTDIFNRFEPTSTSQVVTVPATGGTVFVRLYSYIAGNWVFNDYTYTASGTAVKAVLNTPVPGSTIHGGSATFTWSAGTGVTYYSFRVGTTPGGTNIFNKFEPSSLSQAVSGMPTTGTIYVRLYSYIAGNWVFNDYTYSGAP